MVSKSQAKAQYEAFLLVAHVESKTPLVRVGGILGGFDQSVREDFTQASLESARRAIGFVPLDLSLMGGEPYERWV